jgi:hypothetical protein
VLKGEVVEVSRHEAEQLDRDPKSAGDLSPLFASLIAPGKDGPHYEVRVRFEKSPAASLVIGGRGDAKIATERITLARRIWRAFSQTFRLPL